MGFFKDLFQSKPLSLSDLLHLHAQDGLYKGEILNTLKNMVVFLAFPEEITGPLNLADPSLPFITLIAPDRSGFVLPVFMDPASLKQRSDKLFPHMVEFKSIEKLFENQHCLGILSIAPIRRYRTHEKSYHAFCLP